MNSLFVSNQFIKMITADGRDIYWISIDCFATYVELATFVENKNKLTIFKTTKFQWAVHNFQLGTSSVV